MRIVTAGTIGTDLVRQIVQTEFCFDLLPTVVLSVSCVAALAGMDRIVVVETQRRTAAVASAAATMARMIAVIMVGLCWMKIKGTVLGILLLLGVKLLRQDSDRCPWSCCYSSRPWHGRCSIERRSHRDAVGVAGPAR